MGAARAKIVQTGVVQVPAQVGVVQLMLGQPGGKSDGIQRLVGCCQTLLGQPAAHHWHGKALLSHGCCHQLRKALVLGEGAVRHIVHGQQAFNPFALKEQALLRAEAQVFVLVLPAAGQALAHAQFFEQVLHLGRVIAGYRQVVRAQRAAQAGHAAASAVAAGAVFQLQQRYVAGTCQAQCARCRQRSNAAAGNQYLHLVRAAGCGQWQALLQTVAHGVAAVDRLADKAAADVRRRLAGRSGLAARQSRAGRQRSCAFQHGAALHANAQSCPTRVHRYARAPGSTSGSPRLAYVPCPAENQTAAAGWAGSKSACLRAAWWAGSRAGGWQ